ncbi:MAG: T9SS type A sorting domain-containing protein [Ignavibacteriaceae bacterium]
MKQNYPNPFNPVTRIKYSISEAGPVRITVHNIIGEELALLVNEHKTTGNFEVEINASNLPSGVYFYKLETEKIVDVKKFILLK